MLEELKKDFVKVSREAYDRHLVSATGGNLSTRKNDYVLIKKGAISFRDVTPDDVIVIDLDGNVVEGVGKPSKEIYMHLNIYRMRNEVGAILHAHSPAATAFAVIGKEVPLVTVQASKILKKCPVVKYALPGSRELAESAKEVFKDPEVKVSLLKGHGTVAVGKNLADALNNADLVEDTAKIAILTQQINGLTA